MVRNQISPTHHSQNHPHYLQIPPPTHTPMPTATLSLILSLSLNLRLILLVLPDHATLPPSSALQSHTSAPIYPPG